MPWSNKVANILMTGFTCSKLEEAAMRDKIASVGAMAIPIYVNEDFQDYNK